jgi:hypothetical protein
MSLCICVIVVSEKLSASLYLQQPFIYQEANLLHCIALHCVQSEDEEVCMAANQWIGRQWSLLYLGAGGVHAEVVEAADDALLDVEP